jgi:hypothetical protein
VKTEKSLKSAGPFLGHLFERGCSILFRRSADGEMGFVMRNRDERLLVIIASLLAIFVAVLSVHPVRHSHAGPIQPEEGYFIGRGEGFASSFAAHAKAGPTRLGRFWYSKRIDNPDQFFKVWVNWGDPKHQDATDRDRGFWAHLRLDLKHSADGKWCYEIENWDPSTKAIMAAHVYGQAGSYVAHTKVWDAEKTALKPGVETMLSVQ